MGIMKAMQTKMKLTFAMVVPKKAAICLFIMPNTVLGIKLITIICKISGVPLMTQTNIFVNQRSGLKRVIEHAETIKPSGIAATSVTANSITVSPKPTNSSFVISTNISLN